MWRRWRGFEQSLIAFVVATTSVVAVGCAAANDSSASPLRERVQGAVDEFLDTHAVPGASVAVISGGRLVSVVSGFADLEQQQPIRVDDEFRLASITKTYIAALAVTLDDDGVVALDQPIGRWLSGSPAGLDIRRVTLRQLLSHTSGLRQTATDDDDRGRLLTFADVMARIPSVVCAPGQCWNYADGNYAIAALVLATATGMPPVDEMHDRFFEPLGLTRTHFVGERDAAPLPSYTLEVDPTTFEPVQPPRLRPQRLPIVTDSRAASISASASDAARWADALFNGDLVAGPALGRMLDTSAMRHLPCPAGCPLEYGLGVFHYEFGVDPANYDFVGHDGSSGTIVATDAERGLTIAVLTNGGEQHIADLFEAVLAATDDGDPAHPT